MSYLVDYFHFQGQLRWSLILLFMVLKAGLIVAVFMHMAWERLALIYAILVPPVLVLVFVASWSSNRTTRFSLGLYSLGRGPSGDGATPGVGETMNFLGARIASSQKLVRSFVQLRTRPERANRASRQRMSERGHAEHKVDAASGDQAKSSVGVDATLPPGF
jgi:cytochrome c oxidase subunit IV